MHAKLHNDLPPKGEVVRETNEGSFVKLVVNPRVDMNPEFQRTFVCLYAIKKGYVRERRPWVVLMDSI